MHAQTVALKVLPHGRKSMQAVPAQKGAENAEKDIMFRDGVLHRSLCPLRYYSGEL